MAGAAALLDNGPPDASRIRRIAARFKAGRLGDIADLSTIRPDNACWVHADKDEAWFSWTQFTERRRKQYRNHELFYCSLGCLFAYEQLREHFSRVQAEPESPRTQQARICTTAVERLKRDLQEAMKADMKRIIFGHISKTLENLEKEAEVNADLETWEQQQVQADIRKDMVMIMSTTATAEVVADALVASSSAHLPQTQAVDTACAEQAQFATGKMSGAGAAAVPGNRTGPLERAWGASMDMSIPGISDQDLAKMEFKPEPGIKPEPETPPMHNGQVGPLPALQQPSVHVDGSTAVKQEAAESMTLPGPGSSRAGSLWLQLNTSTPLVPTSLHDPALSVPGLHFSPPRQNSSQHHLTPPLVMAAPATKQGETGPPAISLVEPKQKLRAPRRPDGTSCLSHDNATRRTDELSSHLSPAATNAGSATRPKSSSAVGPASAKKSLLRINLLPVKPAEQPLATPTAGADTPGADCAVVDPATPWSVRGPGEAGAAAFNGDGTPKVCATGDGGATDNGDVALTPRQVAPPPAEEGEGQGPGVGTPDVPSFTPHCTEGLDVPLPTARRGVLQSRTTPVVVSPVALASADPLAIGAAIHTPAANMLEQGTTLSTQLHPHIHIPHVPAVKLAYPQPLLAGAAPAGTAQRETKRRRPSRWSPLPEKRSRLASTWPTPASGPPAHSPDQQRSSLNGGSAEQADQAAGTPRRERLPLPLPAEERFRRLSEGSPCSSRQIEDDTSSSGARALASSDPGQSDLGKNDPADTDRSSGHDPACKGQRGQGQGDGASSPKRRSMWSAGHSELQATQGDVQGQPLRSAGFGHDCHLRQAVCSSGEAAATGIGGGKAGPAGNGWHAGPSDQHEGLVPDVDEKHGVAMGRVLGKRIKGRAVSSEPEDGAASPSSPASSKPSPGGEESDISGMADDTFSDSSRTHSGCITAGSSSTASGSHSSRSRSGGSISARSSADDHHHDRDVDHASGATSGDEGVGCGGFSDSEMDARLEQMRVAAAASRRVAQPTSSGSSVEKVPLAQRRLPGRCGAARSAALLAQMHGTSTGTDRQQAKRVRPRLPHGRRPRLQPLTANTRLGGTPAPAALPFRPRLGSSSQRPSRPPGAKRSSAMPGPRPSRLLHLAEAGREARKDGTFVLRQGTFSTPLALRPGPSSALSGPSTALVVPSRKRGRNRHPGPVRSKPRLPVPEVRATPLPVSTLCARAMSLDQIQILRAHNMRLKKQRWLQLVEEEAPPREAAAGVDREARNTSRPPIRSEVERDQRTTARALVRSEGFTDAAKWKNMTARAARLKFGRSPVHAWGMFAIEAIEPEQFVIEYVGELLRSRLADGREHEYEAHGLDSSYLFRVDDEWVVDATRKGGLARFINHSCDPNCYTKIITVEGLKKIAIYAKRLIRPGEELFYDYKFTFEAEEKKVPCLCGARNCRKYMN